MMGEVLVELGLIDEHRLRHALEISKKERLKLGEMLIRLGYLSEDQVLDILRNLTGVVTLNMKAWTIKKLAQVMLPSQRMREMKAIPLDANSKRAAVVFADPFNYKVVENIKFLINRSITPVLASLAQVDDILDHLDHVGYGIRNLPLNEVKRSIMNPVCHGDGCLGSAETSRRTRVHGSPYLRRDNTGYSEGRTFQALQPPHHN